MSVWKTLLETAIHAPSPHNVQPWRIRIVSDSHADLFIEKRRTLPKEDLSGSFIILTMGLFIEALRILAANRSFNLDHQLYQPPSHFTPEHLARSDDELLPFARLMLSDNTNSISKRFDEALFLTRRTSRISLLPGGVPDATVNALVTLANNWGHRYRQVTEIAIIENILARNIEAVFEDLNEPDYHDEIVEWFRFTDRASKESRDGLDYRCMNSSQISFWLAARLPRLMQLPIARPILHRIYRRQLGHIPTIGMLAGDFWKPEDAFEAGRFLLHFWLELAKHNLYIHPFGNLVTNRPAAQWCEETTGVEGIWLIFKIGFSNEPPKSYRRSVEEVLIA